MPLKSFRKNLRPPEFKLNRLGQVLFTIREVTRIALKINPKLLISVFVINAVWGFLAAPGFYLEKLIIDRLIQNIGNPNFWAVFGAIGGVIGLRLILEFVRNLMNSVSGFISRALARMFSSELEVMMGQKLAALDLATIENPDFKDRFNKVERESGRRAWGMMMPLSDIPNYLVGFVSSLGLLIFLHPLVPLGILIVSLPQFFINQKFIKKEYELNTLLSPLHRVWGWLSYYLVRNRNFMELKSLNLSGYLAQKLKGIQKEVIGKHLELSRKREVSRYASFIPLSLFDFSISLWMVFLVVVRKITVGSFEMYLRALRSAQHNLSGLVSSFLEIYENYIYVNDLVWFLNLKPQISDKAKGEKPHAKTPIIFDKVWFKYRKDQPWIIKNISFEVRPGERIALVGENGAGKTTLIKLLARFYDPQRGMISCGGSGLSKIDLGAWRKRLAILFQKFETYPFSARESIGYGDIKRINEIGEIKKAAKRTGIDKFIEKLPLGYENPLAPEFEKGVDPSIGQWQRIGISRMLFRKNAEVLIMDEPTSNVDPEAEEKIFKELVKISKGKILIFVTQRFSTVRIADRILVMHEGKIIEQGTHEQLMKLDGKYAHLFNLQAKAYTS